MNKSRMLVAVLMVCSMGAAYGQYSGGSGTAEDPYQIATAADLIALGENTGDYGKCFVLTADIDLAGYVFDRAVIAPCLEYYPSDQTEYFTGIFDGNSCVISHLNIVSTEYSYAGLFGCIDSGGLIKNLGLEKVDITCYDYMGGLCGMSLGEIRQCYATGVITRGFHGVGGLCGTNSGMIRQCYAIIDSTGISGMGLAGGLCGENMEGTIQECYAMGLVAGDNIVDGLCGGNWGSIIDSFWDKDITGLTTSTGGWGLTSAQMKQATSFMGWMDGSWTIQEGIDTPRLAWENRGGTVINADYPTRTYSGSGSADNPYQIVTTADLQCLSRRTVDWSRHFVLAGDIDFNDTRFDRAVIAFGSEFGGDFDGNDHVLSNLTIVSGEQDFAGLFYRIGSSGQVKNLRLEKVKVSGGYYIGGLCGMNDGTVSRCFTDGLVTGNELIGGLCGINYYGLITQSYAGGKVMGNGCTGGLCGGNWYGMISQSYATGVVSGGDTLGGLSGYNWYGTINQCYARGVVTGDERIGGFCGDNEGTIRQSYATGRVTGKNYTGGFCGENWGEVTDSFWDREASGKTTSAGGTGLTTKQMKEAQTLVDAGWAFSDMDWDEPNWQIVPFSYPALVWQNIILVTIPNVTSLPEAESIALFNTAGLVASISYDYSSTVPAGLVFRQIPAGSVLAPQGMVVEIFVSLGIKYSGGNGTTEDPFQIATVEDLVTLGANTGDYGKCFILTTDIDLAGRSFDRALIAPFTRSLENLVQFTGSFDGNDHVISNLTIKSNKYSYTGLFGYIGSGGLIKNLSLENVNIAGFYIVGGLCGINNLSTISRCYVSGSVTGDTSIGGLCGINNEGTVMESAAVSTVTGSGHVGGLCGYNHFGVINHSHATSISSGSVDVGSLCGWNNYGTISQCFANGSASGNTFVGGLCGRSSGMISQSYASGLVMGSTAVGGLCGHQSYGTINDCFWDMESSGQAISGGGIGLTTAQMQTLSTFVDAGWDFSDSDGDAADWKMARPGEDYPRLAWQEEIAGDVAGWWGVDAVDLAAMAANWQSDSPARGDVNGDGVVNLVDFALISENWLKS